MATQYRTVSSVNFSLAFLLVALCLGYLLFTAVHVGAAKGGNGKGKPQKPQKPHPQHNSTHPIKPVRNETNSIDSVQGGNGNGGNGNGKGGNGKKKPQQPHPQHNSTHPIKPERNETNANTPVNDRTLIDKINSNQHGWTATEYPRFANLTIGKIRDSLFGLSILLEDQDTPRVDGEPRIELPTSFDARTAWSNCVPTIRDQRSCGACWAFSSSYVLAHRMCVATGGRTKVVLSPEYQVQCDTMEKACQGGYLKYAWQFLQNTGTTLDSCTPYASGSGTFSKGTCPTTCTTTSMAMTKYKAKNYKYISGINNIKAAIMTFGSVQGGFTVYRDFMTYKSGVYKHVSTTTLGGHAVALIGWGTEGGVNYWLAANSWSVNWGDKGYFKIAQGEGGIDSQVYAGEAAV